MNSITPFRKKGRNLFIIAVWLFSCTASGHSQTRKIDSLKKICYSEIPEAERVTAFLELMKQHESMTVEAFGKILNDAAPLLQQIKSPAVQCEYANRKGAYYYSSRNADSAQLMFSRAFEQYKNEPGIGRLLLMLELNLKRKLVKEGKYKEAIEAILHILKKAEEQKFSEVYCRSANAIGFCYMDMGRYEEAISWFGKIFSWQRQPGEQFEWSSYYDNMGSCLNNIGRYDSALYYTNIGIQKSKEEQNLTTEANGLNIKADILINLKRNNEAEALLLQAIDIRKQIGDPNYIASDMAQLSLYYATTGQFEKGVRLAGESLALFQKHQLVFKYMFAYEALKTNYEKMGDTRNQAAVLEKMLALKDSLYSSNSAEALTALQAKYEVEKKEKTIAEQKLGLLKRKFLLYGSFGLMAIILSILAYRFNKYKQQQKIKNEAAMKGAEEKERKRIAAELHDNLGVQANAILHNSTLLNEGDTNNKKLVQNLQETAKEMLVNLRETLWAMKTVDVSGMDIWLRVINFMKQLGRHYPHIQFKTEGTVPEKMILSSGRALNMLLVIQESVNNSVKHAAANTIKVNSELNTGKWVLSVTDNGNGFNINEAGTGKDCYGLQNMQERATASAIALQINSEPGKGTQVILTV